MKTMLLALPLAVAITVVPLRTFAQMGGMMPGGQHMKGYQQQPPASDQPQQPWGAYGMMPGMGGYGMYPGMMTPGYGMMPGMGGYGMYPGMMTPGYGMMPGMGGYGMYPGMMAPGYGMMPPAMGWGPSGGPGPGVFPCQGPFGQEPCVAGTTDVQKYNDFLDRTKDLRRELHMKMFDYMEAKRSSDPDLRERLEGEISELQKKINSAWSAGK